MTIATSTARADYAGDTVSTVFAVPFYFLDGSHLEVVKRDAAGVETVLVKDVHYTVAGAAVPSGGSVTMLTAPASGEQLTIRRKVPITQTLDYVANDPFPAESHERGLDKLTMIVQQEAEEISRSLRAPVTEGALDALPPAADRAGKFMAFDGSGQPVAASGGGGDSGLREDLVGDDGAALVNYKAALLGSAAIPIEWELDARISLQSFSATRLSALTDHSAVFQKAFDAGVSFDIPPGNYVCSNVTQSADNIEVRAIGNVQISKGASGWIWKSTGSHFRIRGVKFRGDAVVPTFTGDNLVLEGDHPILDQCGSRWAQGRALKATGNHVQMLFTNDIYQTADATSGGYDIEIGESGKATLYHQLFGVYSSQPTGGIKLIDTGSAVICGGEFGKLTIASGTSPGGVNGGNTIGARILGNITVELSNAVFECNTFSNITLTFAAGTSGCRVGISNAYASGFTVVNNGNADNLYELSNGSGADAGVWFSAGLYPQEHLSLRQNKAVRARKADGSGWYNLLYGITGDATCIDSGAGGVYLISNGTTLWQAESTSFRPQTDNAYSLGSSGQRASVVYAATGTINTSDAREKLWRGDLQPAELAAAAEIEAEIGVFQWLDAIAQKGDAARLHVGLQAQRVIEILSENGLDPRRYAFVCYDEWDAEDAVVSDGAIVSPPRKAGNRFGLRVDQLALFIAAGARVSRFEQRQQILDLQARLSALEGRV